MINLIKILSNRYIIRFSYLHESQFLENKSYLFGCAVVENYPQSFKHWKFSTKLFLYSFIRNGVMCVLLNGFQIEEWWDSIFSPENETGGKTSRWWCALSPLVTRASRDFFGCSTETTGADGEQLTHQHSLILLHSP